MTQKNSFLGLLRYKSIYILLFAQLLPLIGNVVCVLILMAFAFKRHTLSKIEFFIIISILFSFITTLSSTILLPETYMYSTWGDGMVYHGAEFEIRLFYTFFFFILVLSVSSITNQIELIEIPGFKFLALFLFSITYISLTFVGANTGESMRVGLPVNGNPNQLGYIYLITAILILFNKNILMKSFRLYIITFALLYAVILTGSRSAVFVFAAVFCLILLRSLSLRFKSMRVSKLSLLLDLTILSIILFAIVYFVNSEYDLLANFYFFERVNSVGGLGSRIEILWPSVLSNVMNPLFGNGLGSVRAADSLYIRLYHDLGLFGVLLFSYLIIVSFIKNGVIFRFILSFLLIISITNESLVYGVSIAPLTFIVLLIASGIDRGKKIYCK